jgi:hypothetical protein
MNIDLNQEELDLIQRILTRMVAFVEAEDDSFARVRDKDYRLGKKLLERIIREKP